MRPVKDSKLLFILVLAPFLFLLFATLVTGCSGKAKTGSKEESETKAGFGQFIDYIDSVGSNAVVIACAGDVNFGASITQYLRSNGTGYPWLDAGKYFGSA
ncbi:MAG: hypothetical protein JXA49_10320, partial [Actinobacteria bacterium]|nr:hypothetical protein [Actinomycetota bacterium]